MKESCLPGGEGMVDQSRCYLVGLRQGCAGTQRAPQPGVWCSPHSEWVGLLLGHCWKTFTGTPGHVLHHLLSDFKSILLTIQISDHSEHLLCSDLWGLFTLKMCSHDSCQTTSVVLKTITTGSVNLFIMLPFLASKHMFYSF